MRLDLRDLTKSFADGREVVNNITYGADFGALAVIGPSGGGKSTLLRLIGGLIAPTSGEVWIDGTPVDYDEKALLAHRRGIGFVFQSKGLFSHLTGKQNIMLPLLRVHGYEKDRASDVADELLCRFGLENDGGKLPHELSGGQQQRIAIARAVASKPRLILLDEPTSALDPELTGDVLDMLSELRGEGLKIILVTHEMGFARKACDSVMFISGGRLLEYGGSERIFSQPETPELKAFLGRILEWKA